MTTHEDVFRGLDSMKIVALYRVRGGTAQDRRLELKDLSGVFYMFATQEEGIESAIWLFTNHDAASTMDWSEIYRVTKLGTDLGNRHAQIITLPDPLDTSYTTYQASEDKLVINLLPTFDRTDRLFRVPKEGRRSLEWIIETHALRTCVVNWSASSADATCLSYLPDTIKELKLCGMPNFLNNRVPWKGSCNRHHWVHEFVQNLRSLEKLTLVRCGYDPGDLSCLRNWTAPLEIRVEEGEEGQRD
jgi:hypothetical protein